MAHLNLNYDTLIWLKVNIYIANSFNHVMAARVATTIEKAILAKMYRHGYIGGKHTSEDNIPKGLPKHMHGEVKKSLKNLIRQGYVSYGLEVSLNSARISEIKQILAI
jgi:ribosomal protein S8